MPELNTLKKKTETSYDYDGLENYNSAIKDIEEELGMNEKSKEIINNLKKKIDDLESQVFNLKKKNESLKKNNAESNSKMRRISFVGTRHKLTFGLSAKNLKMDNLEMAGFMKEKSDLQEINEKMLNILTEKEIENEELQENYKLYKQNIKKEIQNYLDIIKDLKEKNEKNAKNKGNLDKNLDDLIKEYNSYKERKEKSLNEYIK